MNSRSLTFLGLLFLAPFFDSCKSVDQPDNLISEDKMVGLLAETHVLESKVGRFSLNSYDSSSVAFIYLQKKLWEKYEVDSVTYNESYDYYAKYPKIFESIYTKVEGRLEEMEVEDKGQPLIKGTTEDE